MMAVDYTTDSLIMPGLVKLQECLCSTLDERGLGAACECVLLHGVNTFPGQPSVGRGFAWVGLNTIFPTKAFPQPAPDQVGCQAPIAASVTVGVIRCYAISTNGESGKDMMMWMEKQMADMNAMRSAITCCAGDDEWDISLGSYMPTGPEGGVYGGTWSLTIGRA